MGKYLDIQPVKTDLRNNLNKLITRSEIESVMRNVPAKKVQYWMASLEKYTKHTKKHLHLEFLELPAIKKEKCQENVARVFFFFSLPPLLEARKCCHGDNSW